METILFDTSYLSADERIQRGAARPAGWTDAVLRRIEAAVPAITPFVAAEVKAGWIIGNWGQKRIDEAQRALDAYLQIPLDPVIVDEWARLKAATRGDGHNDIPHNDIWIAAAAASRGLPLVACDKHFAAIARHMPNVELIELPPLR